MLVAGRSQEAYLRSHAPRARVEFFPIGVDTDFFTPGDHFDPLRLVHVGNNRRDFATLVKGLDLGPGILSAVEGGLDRRLSASKHIIPARPYLTIHEHLNDHDYREILQDCNFSILSLEDGGSSNSLLECMACGLPVVVTDFENISDYINGDFALTYTPGDSTGLCNQSVLLLITIHQEQIWVLPPWNMLRNSDGLFLKIISYKKLINYPDFHIDDKILGTA